MADIGQEIVQMSILNVSYIVIETNTVVNDQVRAPPPKNIRRCDTFPHIVSNFRRAQNEQLRCR